MTTDKDSHRNSPEKSPKKSPKKSEDEISGPGRKAHSPLDMNIRALRVVVKRWFQNMRRHSIGLIAAGVAFYFFLAIFPSIVAVISLYGLVADPSFIIEQIERLSLFIPQEAVSIINEQAKEIIDGNEQKLSIGFAFSLLLAFWSASLGTRAVIKGCNIAYGEIESRSIIKFYAFSMFLMLCLVFVAMATFFLLAALPTIAAFFYLGDVNEMIMLWVRWPLLFVVGVLSVQFIYCYAPNRRAPKWRWVSVGAAGGGIIWIALSAFFSWYVASFGSYNETYGALGAVIILLFWFWLSALILLAGAELNAALEHQTAKDTTRGQSRPMGERGAYVADTIGD